MKIRIMKREVLDTLKDNIEKYIKNYYQCANNDWLYSICDCDPFEDYKVISDFDLADTTQTPAKIDFENCKILYSNLLFLSESQACDERLWAGLAHDVFYIYLRERFNMRAGQVVKDKNPIGNVLTRFFFNGGIRAGLYRNALAKCWWVGHHTWEPNTKSFELLDKMGCSDISTKISDIFNNYNFTNNKKILRGIIEGIYYFNVNNIAFNMRKHCRPALQYLNAVGGGVVLDVLESDEIRAIIIEQMSNRIHGINVIMEELSDFEESDEANQTNIIKTGDSFKFKYINGSKAGTISNAFVVAYNKELHLLPLSETVLGLSIGDAFECVLQNETVHGEIIEIIKNKQDTD